MAHRALTLTVALALFVGSVALIPTLGTELVPELIQGEFFVDAELPPGTHLDVTARRLANLERAAMALDGVTLVYGVAGTSREQGGIAGELRENLSQLTLRVAPPISARARDRADERAAPRARAGRGLRLPLRSPVVLQLQDPDRAGDPGLQPEAARPPRRRGGETAWSGSPGSWT